MKDVFWIWKQCCSTRKSMDRFRDLEWVSLFFKCAWSVLKKDIWTDKLILMRHSQRYDTHRHSNWPFSKLLNQKVDLWSICQTDLHFVHQLATMMQSNWGIWVLPLLVPSRGFSSHLHILKRIINTGLVGWDGTGSTTGSWKEGLSWWISKPNNLSPCVYLVGYKFCVWCCFGSE